MLNRLASAAFEDLQRYYPIVAVTGPRQSGKTTLVRRKCTDRPYANLEEPDTREFASLDPRGFLAQFPDGAVLDEVQRVPLLFSFLQADVDQASSRQARAKFILTGSQQLGLMAGVTQSLAGRVGLLHLLPFAYAEIDRTRPASVLETWLLTGGYPPIYDRRVPPSMWHRDYVATYIERDVRQLLNVRDLASFQRFVRMCAARTGQLLNLSSLAADCGITHNTARAWLSILEASYIAFTLAPWHTTLGKRLVKTSKLYFYDTGLAAWLAGYSDTATLQNSAMRGALFENALVLEAMKYRFNFLKDAACHFYRDSNGNEIDLLLDFAGKRHAIEMKSGTTLAEDWFRPLTRNATLLQANSISLIYGGTQTATRQGVDVVSWKDVPDLLARLLG
jgi:predicted AAA+ superfamily ATPase